MSCSERTTHRPGILSTTTASVAHPLDVSNACDRCRMQNTRIETGTETKSCEQPIEKSARSRPLLAVSRTICVRPIILLGSSAAALHHVESRRVRWCARGVSTCVRRRSACSRVGGGCSRACEAGRRAVRFVYHAPLLYLPCIVATTHTAVGCMWAEVLRDAPSIKAFLDSIDNICIDCDGGWRADGWWAVDCGVTA